MAFAPVLSIHPAFAALAAASPSSAAAATPGRSTFQGRRRAPRGKWRSEESSGPQTPKDARDAHGHGYREGYREGHEDGEEEEVEHSVLAKLALLPPGSERGNLRGAQQDVKRRRPCSRELAALGSSGDLAFPPGRPLGQPAVATHPSNGLHGTAGLTGLGPMGLPPGAPGRHSALRSPHGDGGPPRPTLQQGLIEGGHAAPLLGDKEVGPLEVVEERSSGREKSIREG
jgi:hypothetical protein